jgi:hypothetical protein
MTAFTEIPDIRVLDPLKPSMEIGIIPKSGLIVLDTNFDLQDTALPHFMLIRVGSGGDLFIRDIDGNVIPYLQVLDGQWLVGEGDMIYSEAVIDGNTYTTTCNNIVVYGGQ